MKLRYIIYNIKCRMQKTQPIDYIDWLAKKIFLRETENGVSFSSLGQCYFYI